MRWDSSADARLFMAVLKVHGLKLNYDAIAEHMGDNCTAKAISHRIAKLKDLGGRDRDSKPVSTQTTPRKSPTKRKRSAQDDIVAIKKEHIERSLDSDASSDTYTDPVIMGSPTKRKRPLNAVQIPGPEASFVSTATLQDDAEFDPFCSSSDQSSAFDNFLNSHPYQEAGNTGYSNIPQPEDPPFYVSDFRYLN